MKGAVSVCAKNILTNYKCSPNSILEEFFLFDLVNFMQFLLAQTNFY